MNRTTHIMAWPQGIPVAFVRIVDDRIILGTNLNNSHSHTDEFLAACSESAERLYTSIKELLIQMTVYSTNLTWKED